MSIPPESRSTKSVGHRRPKWVGRQSLVSIAIHMRRALDESDSSRVASFEPLDTYPPIVFRGLPAGDVEVTGQNGHVSTAKRKDIEAAMDRFGSSVRDFVLSLFPDVVDDERFGWWFRDENPPPDFFE